MTLEQHLADLRADAPPGVLRGVQLGTGLVDGYADFESPLGRVAVAFNPSGVSAVDLADDGFEERFRDRFGRDAVAARPPASWRDRITRALERGAPGALPLDLGRVTPFQRKVLEAAAAIPRGEVRPYVWLARRIGRPSATRAVGSVMARNPVPLIVPCHRVVRADGRIGAYSLGGPHNKWVLLEREGADPARLEELAGRGTRYVASATTNVFCLPTCRHAVRIAARNRVELRTRKEAEERGFRPCATCLP